MATPPDASTQAILDMGNDVGEWVRRRFNGCRLVETGYHQTEVALTETTSLMADPLYRRSLKPTWRLIDVKSSTKVKDMHFDDLSLQWHVLVHAENMFLESAVAGMCFGAAYAWRESRKEP